MTKSFTKKLLSFALAVIMAVGALQLPVLAAGEPLDVLPLQPKPDFGLTFGDSLGTNGFEHSVLNEQFAANQDQLGNMSALGAVRLYHYWGWTEYYAGDNDNPLAVTSQTQPKVAFYDKINDGRDPAYKWHGYDKYLSELKQLGISANLCMQGSPTGTLMNWYGDKVSTNPNSYMAYAMSMFQHGARYGGNTDIDPDLVRVAPGTEKKIGLDLVKYYENGNEVDSPWGMTYQPAEFAAMTSAVYDGHMGSMIAWISDDTNKPYSGVGLKNADPDAKLVMAGTTGINLSFLHAMTIWFRDNRTKARFVEIYNAGITNPNSIYYGKSAISANISDADAKALGWVQYPLDVLNMHHYCPDSSVSIGGVSPEDDKLYGGWDNPLETGMKAVMSLRSQYYPNAEVWLSEFGWDTNQGTEYSVRIDSRSYTLPNGAASGTGYFNAGLTANEIQGRWITREYLILAALGVDRAFQFMLDDSGNANEKFATCGLISNTDGQRKNSWYYVKTMQTWLGGLVFDKDITPIDASNMMALRFTAPDNSQRAYALWLTTSRGGDATNNRDFELRLPTGATGARLVTLVNGQASGAAAPLTVTDGKVTVNMTEKPVFVIVDGTNLNDADPVYTINFDVAGGVGGSVAAAIDNQPISTGASVTYGTEIVFTAAADSGYKIKAWTDGGITVRGNKSDTYTMRASANTTIAVEFELIPPVDPNKAQYIPLTASGGWGNTSVDKIIGYNAAGSTMYQSGNLGNPAGVTNEEALGLIASPMVVNSKIAAKGRINDNEIKSILMRFDKPYIITHVVIQVGNDCGPFTGTIKTSAAQVTNNTVSTANWQNPVSYSVASPGSRTGYTVVKTYENPAWNLPAQALYLEASILPRFCSVYVFGYDPEDDGTRYEVAYSVTGGNGSISASVAGVSVGSSPAVVAAGASVVFTVVPSTGFIVKEWKVNGTVQGGEKGNTFTLSDIQDNAAVTVEFSEEPRCGCGCGKVVCDCTDDRPGVYKADLRSRSNVHIARTDVSQFVGHYEGRCNVFAQEVPANNIEIALLLGNAIARDTDYVLEWYYYDSGSPSATEMRVQAGWWGGWPVLFNAGSVTSPVNAWVKGQLDFNLSSAGVLTYKSWFDGVEASSGTVTAGASENFGQISIYFNSPGGKVYLSDVIIFEKADAAVYDVNIASATNGTVSANKTTAAAGETVTLTVAPDPGYVLKAGSLKVNNGDVALNGSGNTYTFVMPAADASVTAEFEPIVQYAVTYGVAAGSGTISATSDGADFASGASVYQGKTILFTAVPADGYRIKGWKLGTASVNGTNAAYSLTVTAAASVTVEFERIPVIQVGEKKWIPLVNVIPAANGWGQNPNDVMIGLSSSYGNTYRSGTICNRSNNLNQPLAAPALTNEEAMGLVATPQVIPNGVRSADISRVNDGDLYHVLIRLDKPYMITDVVLGIGAYSVAGSGTVKYSADPVANSAPGSVTGAAWTGAVPFMYITGNEVFQKIDCGGWTEPVQAILIETNNSARWTSVYVFGCEILEGAAEYDVTYGVVGGSGTLGAAVGGTDIGASPAQVAEGSDIVFTAAPAANYQVKEWTVNGAVQAGQTGNTFTLEDLRAAAAVTVEFERIPVDKSGLADILALAKSKNQGVYTPATVADLRAAIALGESVMDNGEATQGDVDEAIAALEEAINGLVKAELICTVKSMLAKVAKLQHIPYTWLGSGALQFATSNPAVCSVTQDGILIPMKAGIAVITITAPDDSKVIFAVTVSA